MPIASYYIGESSKGQLISAHKAEANFITLFPKVIYQFCRGNKFGHGLLLTCTRKSHKALIYFNACFFLKILIHTATNEVYGYGSNRSGATGLGNSFQEVSSPARVKFSGEVKQIAAGSRHSAVLLSLLKIFF